MAVKEHQLRRVLRWVGLSSCVLLVVAFLFSTRRVLTWDSPRVTHEVSLMLGSVGVGWRPEGWKLENEKHPSVPGWSIASYGGNDPFFWWPEGWRNKHWVSFAVPLWIPFVVLAFPTAVLWYIDMPNFKRRARRLADRFCPKRPKNVRLLSVICLSIVHFAVTSTTFTWPFELYEFFFPLRFGYPTLPEGVAKAYAFIFVLPSPLWGWLWAWAYVRLCNRWFRKIRPNHCVQCGYDLTGNVTGICSECGRKIDQSRSLE